MVRTGRARRAPTGLGIAVEFVLGIMMLSYAVLQATRYADQVAAHGDGLMTVGAAAVGGLGIGLGLGLLRMRAAMRDASDRA